MKKSIPVANQAFVWDFHGTLGINNEKAVVEITNIILSQNSYKERLGLEKCIELYGCKWIDLIKAVIPNEPYNIHANIAKKCIKYSLLNPDITRKYIEQSPMARHVLEVISYQKYDQILISNTQPQAMPMFLEATGLKGIFHEKMILTVDSLEYDPASTKKSVLSEFFRHKHYERLVVIGDTQEDIDLGNEFHGVTYLFRHPDLPKIKTDADYHIDNLVMVLREVIPKDL